MRRSMFGSSVGAVALVAAVVFNFGGQLPSPLFLGTLAKEAETLAEFFASQPVLPSADFIDLISRDSEALIHPAIPFGHKFITGGAGEGYQRLRPEDSFEHREQVKSDNVLPAYCEPPNPCPLGYSADDGCLLEFENTADFSRNYQGQQQCLCDEEHMFNCPSKSSRAEYEEDLEAMLEKNGLHKSLIAKKFHETRPLEPRRKKRSALEHAEPRHHRPRNPYPSNPYMAGEPLRSVSKKDGKHVGNM